jgi:hypothetical protein
MICFVNDTADVFTKLAMAGVSDHLMLATFIATNKELTQQIATKDAEIIKVQSQLPICSRLQPTTLPGPQSDHPAFHQYQLLLDAWPQHL